MSGYNALNEIDINLEKCGICVRCGRRFTDPKCEHATPEQIEATKKLDAEMDEQDIFGRARDIEHEIDAQIIATAGLCGLVHRRVNNNINGGVRHQEFDDMAKDWAQQVTELRGGL